MNISVSQVTTYDSCNLKWWFKHVQRLPDPPPKSMEEGSHAHGLIEHYLRTGEEPEGRVKLGKAIRGAIAAGLFPTPGPDLLIEYRFSGQPKLDAAGNWVELEDSPIVAHGAQFDGFIDLMYRRDEVPSVDDHKITSDIYAPWNKKADELIGTVQMPVYGLVAFHKWPDADKVRLTHNYVSKRGVESEKRSQVVTRDQVLERWATIQTSVAGMIQTRRAERQEDVPFNRKVCRDYRGCPFQSSCKAYQENKVALTAEELALFDTAPKKDPRPQIEAMAAELEKRGDIIKVVTVAAANVTPEGTPNDPGLPPPGYANASGTTANTTPPPAPAKSDVRYSCATEIMPPLVIELGPATIAALAGMLKR